MPVKNRLKVYREGGVYHIYNRGIDGREVFGDAEDYEVWINLMDRYLGKWKVEENTRYKGERPYIVKHKQEMNLSGQVKVLAYCLMPDHFHILARQEDSDGITKLMRRLMTNYVMHYNRKNRRRGMLFENVYRAVLLPDDDTAVWMTKYIHLNPVVKSVRRFGLVETSNVVAPEYYLYSSFRNYLGERNDTWVDNGWVNDRMQSLVQPFGKRVGYQDFVNDNLTWKLPDLKAFSLE